MGDPSSNGRTLPATAWRQPAGASACRGMPLATTGPAALDPSPSRANRLGISSGLCACLNEWWAGGEAKPSSAQPNDSIRLESVGCTRSIGHGLHSDLATPARSDRPAPPKAPRCELVHRPSLGWGTPAAIH